VLLCIGCPRVAGAAYIFLVCSKSGSWPISSARLDIYNAGQ
jgi:hypothetical protein